MGKIICEKCQTEFKFEFAKDLECCPICGAPFSGNEESTPDEELSFGDGIELGENDSFDEDKIDFWWYSIREPGEVWEGITYKNGTVFTNCAKCGHLAGTTPYPIARTKDYLLISPRYIGKCYHCGNEMKNHILSKRPVDWVEQNKYIIPESNCDNVPKCPICSSTKIHKISMTNKAVSALAFGLLATGHVSKTYKCDACGAKF